MQLLLRMLGLVKQDETALEYERRHGRFLAVRAARERVNQLYREGLLSHPSWEALSPALERQELSEAEARQQLLREQLQLQKEEQEDARLEGLRAQRAM